MRRFLLSAVLLLAAAFLQAQDLRMLVGSYTGSGENSGAFLYSFNPADGSTALLAAEPKALNTSFLIPSADRTRVWACCEYNDNRQGVYALRLGGQELELINFQSNCPSGSGNGNPCNILYLNGYVFIANYFGGSVTLFPVAADGSLEPLRKDFYFGERSRMHCCQVSPDGQWLFASDLGCDAIRRFRITPGGELPVGEPDIAYQATPGSGPRHFIFSADGRYCYLLGELGDTLTVLRYENGTLTPVQELKAYRGRGKGSADIHLSPDGRFLYTSHRLRKDGIAIFRVDPQTGRVRRAGYQRTGTHPRNFTLSPDGRWLLCACRDDDSIEVYARDAKTGALRLQKDRTVRLNHPVCVQIF
ncbi:MAG: lactonase family protein [Bacteroidales bacterium]|nr:lactonase family protein [Bacteroidales bacterium]